ncbi:MAG: AAA family ATPase, partial [Oceanobacter sp.]
MKQHLMLDRLLTLWSGLKSSDRFRAIDLQVGQQIQTWEHGRARMPEQDLPVSALLGCLVSYCLSRGQVCLRLDRSPIFELTDAWPSAEYWLALLEKMSSVWFCSVEDAQESGGGGWQGQPLIFEVAGDGIQRLYLARYYFYQQDVIDQIHQRRTSIALDSDQMDLIREWLPKLFPMPQSEVDWQAIAAVTALRQSVTLIVGGPGTGKTTTVTRLMAFLNVLNPRVRIAMAAPTGKAASRMTESVRNAKGQLTVDLSAHLPEEASTLHRLLGWGPSGFRYGTDRPLPYDCLIIDEASMIDLPMMRHLVTALSPTAKLVLLGDKHQLTSVEAGSVLSDFCGSERTVDRDESYLSFLAYLFGDNVRQILPYREGGIDSSNGVSGYRGPLCNSVVELQVSHRFSRDSGIGKLASLIKRGDADRSFA